jgi:hypothetical protein
MFWSDIGRNVKIVRASLSGTDMEAIITSGLVFPISIAIDQEDSRLVWVDWSRDTLETSDFNGDSRRVISRLSHTEFYDVAVFKVREPLITFTAFIIIVYGGRFVPCRIFAPRGAR